MRLRGRRLQLVEAAEAAGWRLDRPKKGRKHPRLVPPDRSRPVIYFSSTPSDWRGDKNLAADLRRAGVDV